MYNLISFMLLIMLCGCSDLNKSLGIPDDHIMEEIVEGVIYNELKLDIDLTPESPESPESPEAQ